MEPHATAAPRDPFACPGQVVQRLSQGGGIVIGPNSVLPRQGLKPTWKFFAEIRLHIR